MTWTDDLGKAALNYSGLFAYDSVGRDLPARIAIGDNEIVLIVDDFNAVYPITIDPHIVGVELQPVAVGGSDQTLANFGWSSAINGDGTTVIVGAPMDRDFIVGSGTAYVFVKDGGVWSQQQELQPTADGTNRASDIFGWSVAISTDGNTALVGAYFADCSAGVGGCGAVYVFVRNAGVWTQQAKIQQIAGDLPGDIGTDDGSSDQFGYAVDISGDGQTAIIGARYDDDDGPNSGSVYVFIKNGAAWNLQQKILRFPDPAVPPSNDPVFWGQIANWGQAVGISNNGNIAVIGAPGIPGACSGLNLADCGSVFVYIRNAGVWAVEQELAPNATDLVFNMKFGHSAAISGDGSTVVVGAMDGNLNDPTSGQSFVFVSNAGVWSQQAKLLGLPRSFSGAQCCEQFGKSVAISDDGNVVVVGRYDNDICNALGLSGSAFVFARNGVVWSNGHQLQQPQADIGQADFFGYSVGMSGDGTSVVVGAPQDDDNGNNSGSAYVLGLDLTGTITIIKDAVLDDPQDFLFGLFGGDLGAQIDFTMDDDADPALPNRNVFLLAPGEYFAFESAGASPPGWSLSNRACVDPDGGPSVVQGGLLSGIGVVIDLDAGEHITCTFTNTKAGGNPAVPSLSQWGLIALTGLLAAVFVWRVWFNPRGTAVPLRPTD